MSIYNIFISAEEKMFTLSVNSLVCLIAEILNKLYGYIHENIARGSPPVKNQIRFGGNLDLEL